MDGGLSSGFSGGLYSTQAGVSFRALAGGVGLPIAAGAPATVTGTLSKTLGAKTLVGAATVGVSATLAKTLGAKTLSGTAGVSVLAALSKTLGAKTIVGTATVTTPGAASTMRLHASGLESRRRRLRSRLR